MLVRIDTGYFVAGCVVEDGIVTEAAPILAWTIGKPIAQVAKWKKIQEIEYMAKTYTKVGKGSLFNEDQEGNEKKPAFKGKVDISGREFDMAGWKRQSQKGTNYISIQFTSGDNVVGNGAFFMRDRSSPKAPLFTGPGEIDGRKFEFGVWPQKSERTGLEYYRVKVEIVEGE